MSKLVGNIINEIEESEVIEDDFGIFVISIVFDDAGEISSTKLVQPIERIEFDPGSEECLLQAEAHGPALKISEAYSEIAVIDPRFSLVASYEQTIEDNWVRIDRPIIGFGENIEEKQLFVVCEA